MPADPKTTALDQLAAIVAEREALEHRITAAVAAARQAGAGWTEIGARVGMLRPNASRKYAPLIEERVTVTVKEQQP